MWRPLRARSPRRARAPGARPCRRPRRTAPSAPRPRRAAGSARRAAARRATGRMRARRRAGGRPTSASSARRGEREVDRLDRRRRRSPAASSSSSTRPARAQRERARARRAAAAATRPRALAPPRAAPPSHGFSSGGAQTASTSAPAGAQHAARLAQRRLRVGQQHVARAAQDRRRSTRLRVDPLGSIGLNSTLRTPSRSPWRARDLDHRLGAVGADQRPARVQRARRRGSRCRRGRRRARGSSGPAAASSRVDHPVRDGQRRGAEQLVAPASQPAAARSQRSRLSAR